MSFDPVSALLDFGGKLIDKLIPDPTAKAAAVQQLAELNQKGELAQLAADTQIMQGQIDVDKVEAASPLTFISGARPAVIWVCCAGLAVEYVVGPLIAWGSALFLHPISAPHTDVATLVPLLTAILGLSAMRSYDKTQGNASK